MRFNTSQGSTLIRMRRGDPVHETSLRVNLIGNLFAQKDENETFLRLRGSQPDYHTT